MPGEGVVLPGPTEPPSGDSFWGCCVRKPVLAIVTVAATGLLALTAPTLEAGAASWNPVGNWKLNEPVNTSTAIDSSGSGLDADVGTEVNTGLTLKRRTYVNFPTTGAWGPPNDERLILVPDDPMLDPGDSTYRIVIVFRTRASGVNVIQKGQSGTVGGYWKIETHRGLASCFFRGGDRQQSGVGSGERVDDGKWHKVVCTRYPDRTVMRVDGKITATRWAPSGTVSNIKPLSIGGKSECGGSVGCDYYIGDIDYIRIKRL